jgi:hypothetical protein
LITVVVGSVVTVSLVLPELPLKLLSPLYVAVIVWVATLSALVTLALPPLSGAVPRSVFVVVSTKSTVPVGVAEPLPLTVAVKVTGWPKTDEGGDALTAVLVPMNWLTISESGAEVLLRKVPSPL